MFFGSKEIVTKIGRDREREKEGMTMRGSRCRCVSSPRYVLFSIFFFYFFIPTNDYLHIVDAYDDDNIRDNEWPPPQWDEPQKKKSWETDVSRATSKFFFSFLFLFLLLTIIFSYYWLITTQPPLARKHEVGVVLWAANEPYQGQTTTDVWPRSISFFHILFLFFQLIFSFVFIGSYFATRQRQDDIPTPLLWAANEHTGAKQWQLSFSSGNVFWCSFSLLFD
jgi:hypothetical protein